MGPRTNLWSLDQGLVVASDAVEDLLYGERRKHDSQYTRNHPRLSFAQPRDQPLAAVQDAPANEIDGGAEIGRKGAEAQVYFSEKWPHRQSVKRVKSTVAVEQWLSALSLCRKAPISHARNILPADCFTDRLGKIHRRSRTTTVVMETPSIGSEALPVMRDPSAPNRPLLRKSSA